MPRRLALLLLLSTASSAGAATPYLTGPSDADPLDICMGYLARNRAPLELDADDLLDARVVSRARSPQSGVTHIYLRQRLHGIDVAHADSGLSVDREGRLVRLDDRLVRGLARRANARRPAIPATAALYHAASALGLGAPTPRVLRQPRGPARETELDRADVSLDPIPARLVYLPLPDGRPRLAWNLVVRTAEHWWDLYVDAVDGSLLERFDWTLEASYRVFPFPQRDPDAGTRSLITDPEDPIASPFGWHDTDGVPGPDEFATDGNHATAYEDGDADDTGTPVASPSLVFDFPLDLSDPSISTEASVTNAFYWNGVLHDLHYRYGFDEASGNFQVNNYGAGGFAGDPVIVEVQDGGGANNANFSAPPDGLPGVMQVHPWHVAFTEVHTPPAIAGPMTSAPASFGPPFDATGITGTVVLAFDPADENGASLLDGCSPFMNANLVAGNIALIERGTCAFVDKVSNAEAAGAIAAIIVNQAPDPFRMNGPPTTIAIPSLMIGSEDGAQIRTHFFEGVDVTLTGGIRDGSFDGALLTHEYGHGISVRLVGGPADSSCLNLAQPSAMGEGWSDWWALALTVESGDTGLEPRGFATWSLGAPPTSRGLRTRPYSIDLAIHDATYGDLATLIFLHDRGEVWALGLWEMFWNLAESDGFDADLVTGSGGNNTALWLVMEGLKLTPCDPTFLDGRDAILTADRLMFGGVHECRLWGAFARRGMGEDADDLDQPSSNTPIEGFAIPAACPVCGDVNGDGAADLLDAVALDRALLALSPPLVLPERCNVAGLTDPNDADLDGISNDCDAADAAAMRLELAGLAPGIRPLCQQPIAPLP